MHIHVESPDGEAKFWVEPVIALASETGMKTKELNEIQDYIKENKNEIISRWKKHFGE